jgi:F420-non-reducing hydrogenase large subunit
MRRVTIDPITRLEGHGKIEIFLNDAGDVENAYFQVPELRGFERFCVGRPIIELPRIVTRLCGVCPGAHHMASGKAVDAVYHVDPPSVAKKLRELFYSAHYIHSHIAHFYALAAPDFVVGPDAPPEKRNILGVVEKVGLEIGSEVIKHRKFGQEIQTICAGKCTHPVWTLPGGVSKGITEDDKLKIVDMAKSCVEFSKFSLKVFNDVVLKNKKYVDIILSDIYVLNPYYMGLVDSRNRVNFYDGKVRVVDQDAKELCKYEAKDYREHVAEHVEPYSYLKYPFLKKVGWKGFVDGKDSGVYIASPLSRLNAADGMATPVAQEEYDRFYKTLGKKPVHSTLATHWARLVELVYASERALELAVDPEITDPKVRTIPTETPTEGVGIVESPRGTLTHHYKSDANGITTGVNLIVGTTNNNAPISMSIKKAAQKLIKKGDVNQGLLNMVEMAFRAYDPCFSCATHTLPGEMPLKINIYDKDRNLLRTITRD